MGKSQSDAVRVVKNEAATAMEPTGGSGISFPAGLKRSFCNNVLELLALAAGATLWEVAGWALKLQWLPPFSKVLTELIAFVQNGAIAANIGASLQGLVIGFTLSLVLGVVIGALMGRYRLIEKALDVYVHALFICPSIIFAPIFFAIFGLSDAARIAIIVVYSMFVIVINTATAVRTVDPSLVEMARSFGCREREIFMRILLPASLPLVFAGIRLGIGRAVKGMINGEMLIAFVGLGALAQRYGSQFDAAKVFAIAMVVLIIGLVSNWFVQVIDNRLTSWAD